MDALFPQEDVKERVRAKNRELERLRRELDDRRERGNPEEVAALEHELADLEVRGVEGTPIGDVLDVGRAMPKGTTRRTRVALMLLGIIGLVALAVIERS